MCLTQSGCLRDNGCKTENTFQPDDGFLYRRTTWRRHPAWLCRLLSLWHTTWHHQTWWRHPIRRHHFAWILQMLYPTMIDTQLMNWPAPLALPHWTVECGFRTGQHGFSKQYIAEWSCQHTFWCPASCYTFCDVLYDVLSSLDVKVALCHSKERHVQSEKSICEQRESNYGHFRWSSVSKPALACASKTLTISDVRPQPQGDPNQTAVTSRSSRLQPTASLSRKNVRNDPS